MEIRYKFLPQHFLSLQPLPQIQGSFRPVFGASRVIGFLGGQQFVLVHPGSLSSIIWSAERSLFSFISILYYSLVPIRWDS